MLAINGASEDARRALISVSVGRIDASLGRFEDAERRYLDGLDRFGRVDHGRPEGVVDVLLALGKLRLKTGDPGARGGALRRSARSQPA